MTAKKPSPGRSFCRRWAAAIGPGLITAAVVLGPGSITVSSRCGAQLGYSLLWVVAVAVILMIVYTQMGARLGLTSSKSFLALAAGTFGRWVAVIIGLSGFFIATGFQTGNNVGVGLAMDALFGGGMPLWATIFTLLALVIMWTSTRMYQLLERIMAALVALMILCFVGDMAMIRPRFGELALGFLPSIPRVFGLVVAISATTFSVAAAAFQAYLVQSKGWRRDDRSRGLRDATVGIVLLGTISCVIMITSATVLQPRGIAVNNAVEMAMQLEPLLGRFAKILFLLGLWAGAFSSFIINALIGGTLLADGLGLGCRLEDPWPKRLASAVMVLGTALAIVFGKNPIQALVVAQASTIVGVPFIALIMLLLANRESVMGAALKNRPGINVLAGAGLVWLLVLSGRTVFAVLAMLRNLFS